MKLRAPAKINLGLRILGRREDGYHRIDSVFLPLEWADELELEDAPPGEVTFALTGQPEPEVPTGPENLAVRAARAFRAAAGPGPGVALRLNKQLPSGAGLGGGSSDAAAVLRGLAAREPEALSREALAAVALELGADVPYFLDPRPAHVRGIGEQIEPLAGIRPISILLARAGAPLATSEVFQAFDRSPAEFGPASSLTPEGAEPTIRPLWALREEGGLVQAGPLLRGLLHNDLEPVAGSLRPEVAQLRREIEESGALAAAMSGSGPVVYGLFEDEGRATAAVVRFRERSEVSVTVTRTLASP
ncbi:MAG: 4-(cytidine 5'-diphospho)-2-C-methyl-D-erythritol kinase [Deltaproteobacteria bacterium]|nr:4-(cytidine 5'-diphospho)-2-C-methyl-D-erythritol kinase [Deltaproteobacteria bacterium]MBW2394199.1 4-(cytidine 5'-diphospho)-2-C-methyl-D-erythritol kinase [Deltaproteobacteria bacterium]